MDPCLLFCCCLFILNRFRMRFSCDTELENLYFYLIEMSAKYLWNIQMSHCFDTLLSNCCRFCIFKNTINSTADTLSNMLKKYIRRNYVLQGHLKKKREKSNYNFILEKKTNS